MITESLIDSTELDVHVPLREQVLYFFFTCPCVVISVGNNTSASVALVSYPDYFSLNKKSSQDHTRTGNLSKSV